MRKFAITSITIVLVLIVAKVSYDLFLMLPESYVSGNGLLHGNLQSYKMPTPELTPGDVVEIQLQALKNNDDTDEGIERAFNFISSYFSKDENSLRTFTNIVKSEDFQAILNYADVEKSPVRYHYHTAFQMVEVSDKNKRKVVFLFTLKRHHDDPYKGCWMTESVQKIKEDKPPDWI